MGGVIVESGKFDWGNGKFPEFTSPSPGYHGITFHETFGDFSYTMKARMEIMRTFGPCAFPTQPLAAFAGARVAARAHGAALRKCLPRGEVPAGRSARRVGELPGAAGQQVFFAGKKYLPKGASGLLNFGVKGGAKAGERFIEASAVHEPSANIGDAKTLGDPSRLDHAPADERGRPAAGGRDARHGAHLGRHRDARRHLWDIDQALHEAAKS